MNQSIIDGIRRAQSEQAPYQLVYTNSAAVSGKNEFLFFIKPEITLSSPDIRLKEILEMIVGKIHDFGFQIKNASVLSASYLQQYNIIAQHYGVINQIATNAKANLSETARNKFKEIYGKSIEECQVLGGIEFLQKVPAFNALSLDFLWQNKENKKLAGGTYAEDIKIDGEVMHVINGFHPRQLVHFTEKGRSIVVFTLVGDLSWAEARTRFIGATNPEKAENGSVRKTLLENKEAFGLAEVSQGMNGVHLSAGPVEGLVELVRYNSDFSNATAVKTYKDFSFGKALSEKFTETQISKILSNANVSVEGKSVSIFDLTEEKNSDEALTILTQCGL